METDVTIISVNISKNILNNYQDYQVIENNFVVSNLLKYPKLIFFNALNKLENEEIKELYNILKSNNIKYINVTNNIEEVLLTSNLIVYMDDKEVVSGDTLEVLKNEKLLKRIGLSLPFMVELSMYLQDYNLVDKIYLDKDELEGVLWK